MNRTMKSRTVALVGASLVIGAMAVGCSPLGATSDGDDEGTDSAYDSIQALPADERMDALVAAAEEEGSVTVYLRSDVVFPEIEEAFESEYDIDLEILNPGLPTAVYQQISEGSAAGRQQADVVETFSYELELVYPEEGLVAPMPDFLKEVAPDPSLASDHSIEVWSYPFVPVWNTNEIASAEAPTSLEDFADPVWADSLVMARGDFLWSWYRAAFEHMTQEQGMSVEDFEALMGTISANASFAESSNPASQGIASGEFKGGVNIALTSAQKLGETAPIAWEPTPEPAIAVPLGVSLIQDAPHPNAAMLFADWYLTEGSDIVEEEQFIVQNENEQDLAGVEVVRTNLEGMTLDEVDEWRVAFDNLSSGKTPILPESVRG